LKRILGKKGGRVWIGFMWLKIGTDGGSCEHGNKPSGSIKGGEFFEQLSAYKLFKKDFALRN
jgi:hypothetical protein